MKAAKKAEKIKPTLEIITVQLDYTAEQHRCLSALAAFHGDCVEEFIKSASFQIGKIESSSLGDEIDKGLSV